MVVEQQTVPRHRWGLGAFLLVESAYLLTSLLLAMAIAGSGQPQISTIVLVVGVPSAVAAGLAILVTCWRGNGPRLDLRLQWSWRSAGIGLLFGILGLFVTIPAALLWVQIIGEDANSAAGEVFSGLRASWGWAVAVFVLIAVIAPICEEIVYRGLLWGAVEQRWGRWLAFGVTTVVFSIASNDQNLWMSLGVGA